MNDELLMQALQNGQITPEEYKQFKQNLQGLLGGQSAYDEQLGRHQGERDYLQSPVAMPQAPEPTMPMIPMPQHEALQKAKMTPMPQTNTGLETPTERDFLQQFVDSVKSPLESRGTDTPQERDYMRDIMQNYNKGHNYLGSKY